ncbi:MAG: SusC/RagA family TonB-linked outer membrane protein, partial [Thalassobius sp.]|nr:SusC/RagA family TonB-linked outer membrane protein [Thalassovita sp.]
MVAAPSVSQSIEKVKVNVDTKNAGLIEVFSVVEKQTDFVFIYNQEVRENRSKFNFDLKEISVADLLRKIAESTDFRFKQINSNITVTKKEADSTEKENTDSVIIGKVIDESTGEALVGVNVLVKGTTKGSITDVDGNFRLEASEDATLVFSFIGYETQEVSIGTRTEFNVALKASSDELSEVVIVGYGIQEKSDVTGVVNSVNSEDISEIPTTNPLQALKGKVSGLDIYNSGNEPGSSVSINIRGQRSIGADNSPLIILDGIPIIGGLNDISPNDIESIEILKDASATAIYGSRASNGVILITTKRGHDGKTVISYDGYYGVTNVIKKLDLMDGSQFAQLRREAERTASGAYPDDEDIFDNIALNSLVTGDYTDWQDFTFEAGHKQNHQLSLNGGSDKLQFAASGNYFDEQGIVSSSKYERTSARLNLDYQVNDKLKFGASSFASYSKQDYTAADLFDNVLRLSPLGKPYDEEGNILFRPTSDEGQRVNPLSDIANSVDERFTTRVFASFFGEYKLAKGLTYRLNVGPDAKFYKRGYFYGSETTQSQGGTSLAGTSDSDVKSITVENMLTYNKEVGKHSFGTTLVQSYQGQVTRTSSINVNDLPYDSQGYNNLGSAGEVLNVNSNYQKWELLSYTARINYKFNDRYLFTFTARADGSSRFAEGEKWGFFPSAAVAWRLSDEPFLADVDMLSNLKLRASYGETGNTAISPYQTFSTLEESSYVFGTTGAAGFQPGTISNPNLKWETTKQLNAGIEFAFWDTRVSGSVDYYMAKTDDLLLSRSLPSSSGFTDVFENIGATENKGVDIQLSFKNITSSNNGFQWQTDLT